METRRIQKRVNGFRISYSSKHDCYNIRKDGKIVGRAYNINQAIEACKAVKTA